MPVAVSGVACQHQSMAQEPNPAPQLERVNCHHVPRNVLELLPLKIALSTDGINRPKLNFSDATVTTSGQLD